MLNIGFLNKFTIFTGSMHFVYISVQPYDIIYSKMYCVNNQV